MTGVEAISTHKCNTWHDPGTRQLNSLFYLCPPFVVLGKEQARQGTPYNRLELILSKPQCVGSMFTSGDLAKIGRLESSA